MRPFTKLAQIETYLFEVVSPRFAADGSIGAFDFFCIVIWKANRAKSKVATRLLKAGAGGLESSVRKLTNGIFQAGSHSDRMKLIMSEWGFRLPMASAILTVLYPHEFTVYDVRVCAILKRFETIANATSHDTIWREYSRYKQAVIEETPNQCSLRDRDRELWGRSFAIQLERQIAAGFMKAEPDAVTDS